MQVVLIGPPGAGKGTQAGTVAELVGVAHVASGDLFREAVKSGSERGREVKAFMDRGELVPDELTVAMVMDRLRQPDCQRGFILDGFPRSLGQARALDEMLEREGRRIDRVINIQVPEVTLLARLSGRWLCRACHASYHTLYSPPAVEGVCDRCGGELYQRVDDREETARRRLEVYFMETVPVLEYYRGRGNLVEVDGDRSIEAVTRALCDALPPSAGQV
ncbi:MAG TPA: adenylate kinase [Chloroflexota bacterium]|nr:adenylate kinase [Chloroflexota bacterium]